jgi:hypothetical protein
MESIRAADRDDIHGWFLCQQIFDAPVRPTVVLRSEFIGPLTFNVTHSRKSGHLGDVLGVTLGNSTAPHDSKSYVAHNTSHSLVTNHKLKIENRKS